MLTNYKYDTDPNTGELTGTMTVTGVQIGSSFRTPAQQEQSRRYYELLDRRRSLQRSFGQFNFVSRERQLTDVSAETAARLVYLSTYLTYDTGQLVHSKDKPLYRKELPKLMELSASTVSRFVKDATEYLLENEDGTLFMPGDMFRRGSIDRGESYLKAYRSAIRQVYKKAGRTNHKRLGYIFQMLPYMNIEYNVLCWNPNETDKNLIEYMTATQFCKAIGYDKGQQSRLKREYAKILFEVEGRRERFCSFVDDGVNHGEAKIYVNPSVVYSGHSYDLVKLVGMFDAERPLLDIFETK